MRLLFPPAFPLSPFTPSKAPPTAYSTTPKHPIPKHAQSPIKHHQIHHPPLPCAPPTPRSNTRGHQAPSWYDEAECSDGPTVAQERLAQLLRCHPPPASHHPPPNNHQPPPTTHHPPPRQITVLQPEESASLMEQLESVEPLLIESRVGLIVLDSVAALARKDFGVNKGVERSKVWHMDTPPPLPPPPPPPSNHPTPPPPPGPRGAGGSPQAPRGRV